MSTSLTFGTMPRINDFLDAVINAETGPCYKIDLVMADYENLASAALFSPSYYLDPAADRPAVVYSGEQLYAVVCSLVWLHNTDSDAEYATWAGRFASDIMATLGWEWV